VTAFVVDRPFGLSTPLSSRNTVVVLNASRTVRGGLDGVGVVWVEIQPSTGHVDASPNFRRVHSHAKVTPKPKPLARRQGTRFVRVWVASSPTYPGRRGQVWARLCRCSVFGSATALDGLQTYSSAERCACVASSTSGHVSRSYFENFIRLSMSSPNLTVTPGLRVVPTLFRVESVREPPASHPRGVRCQSSHSELRATDAMIRGEGVHRQP
jgi:hypothetical protein